MKRFCEILPLLVLLLFTGCRSHRATVSQESARYQRAILDSTVTSADTVRRVDSATAQWLSDLVELEWDSVDYRVLRDSTGRAIGATGIRRASRRATTTSRGQCSAALSESSMSQASTLAHVDSIAVVTRLEETKERTTAGSGLGWARLLGLSLLLVLAVGGVIHVRTVTERWSKRR